MENKKIKGIIFDLDDTLFDCSGSLVKQARVRAAKSLVKDKLPLTEKQAYQKQLDILKKYGPACNVFEKIAEEFEVNDSKVAQNAFHAYNNGNVEDIEVFDGTKELLKELKKKYKLAIVTSGLHDRQEKKITKLGIRKFFDSIHVVDAEIGMSKEQSFNEVCKEWKVNPSEVISVGDRLLSEIRVGNILGMYTVRLLHGRFKEMVAKNDIEVPDYTIKKLPELKKCVTTIEMSLTNSALRVVAVGGGTGLPNVLKGFKKITKNLTAVVTVTDAGKSSGQLRKDFGVLPPGDIRNCIVALSDSEKLLQDLFLYRFDAGTLKGHNFGNLFITAMTKVAGSFEEALRKTSRILKIKGKVLPSSLEDIHICARLENGKKIKSDIDIYKRKDPSKIEEVYLEPKSPKGHKETIDEILAAHVILLGPGSLFTSILPNILIPDIAKAIKKSKAKKIYVCNMIEQPGQTTGFTVKDHVDAIEKYLGEDVIDFVVINNKLPSTEILKRYEKAGSKIIPDDFKDKERKVAVDLLLENKDTRNQAGKHDLDLIRHDPKKIVDVVMKCM